MLTVSWFPVLKLVEIPVNKGDNKPLRCLLILTSVNLLL
jgi:hypothetical protein